MSWRKFKAALSHAFGYDDGRADISEEDHELLRKVADWVVGRRLEIPAILMLEGTAPLNFLGSSVMSFFRPMVGVVFSTVQWERFEQLLDKRCSPHLLVEYIEARTAQRNQPDQRGQPDPKPE